MLAAAVGAWSQGSGTGWSHVTGIAAPGCDSRRGLPGCRTRNRPAAAGEPLTLRPTVATLAGWGAGCAGASPGRWLSGAAAVAASCTRPPHMGGCACVQPVQPGATLPPPGSGALPPGSRMPPCSSSSSSSGAQQQVAVIAGSQVQGVARQCCSGGSCGCCGGPTTSLTPCSSRRQHWWCLHAAGVGFRRQLGSQSCSRAEGTGRECGRCAPPAAAGSRASRVMQLHPPHPAVRSRWVPFCHTPGSNSSLGVHCRGGGWQEGVQPAARSLGGPHWPLTTAAGGSSGGLGQFFGGCGVCGGCCGGGLYQGQVQAAGHL
jgi:hypothetical protein